MAKIVIALGGNALGNSPEEQSINVLTPAREIVKLLMDGHDVIITHGNGPQVGAIFNAFNIAHSIDEKIPQMPFAESGAMSQGYIGYHLYIALMNELKKQKIEKDVIYFLTQTIVDSNDPAFKNPTKPVGAFYKTKQEAIEHNSKNSTIIEVPNKGFRKVVPSPKPITFMGINNIKKMFDEHKLIICGGGGGIPTIITNNTYQGVDGVIDKDYGAAMIAKQVNADLLIILTNVSSVCINYDKPNQKNIAKATIAEINKWIKENQFAPGSMLPKILAAIDFASINNKKAIIGNLDNLSNILAGKSGTIIVK